LKVYRETMANKRLNAVITIGGAITGSLRSALGSAKGGLLEVGQAIDKVKARQRELTRVMEQHTRAGTAASQLSAHYAQQELSQLDKKLAKLRQVQALETKRQANAEARKAAGGALMGGVVGAAVAAAPVIGATKAASDFQYELQLIGNTADMTREQILALGAEIMRVSQATGQSADNTRKAMGFLVAAGLDVKTAQGALVNIGKTATATGGDVEDISKAAFTLIDTLKIKPGQELQEALDTLAQAGKEGNVELKDMAKTLPVLGSGFQALKMTGREAAASMGAALEIARKGASDADEAANNVKNFIAKVMSPETLKKAKKTFNLDLYKIITDAQKTGKNPFDESMKAIMKATKGDQKAIGELFSDMQVQNFIRPMIQNWDEYIRIKKKALTADGVIERDFGKMRETSKQQMAEFSNTLGRLAIIVGTALLPALTSVLQAITPIAQQVATFAAENPKLVAGIIGVVGGLIALRVGLMAATFAWTTLQGAWLTTVAIFTRAVIPTFMFLARTVLPAVGTALLAIARVLLLNPIGLAVTAIAGGAILIYKNWEPIKAFFIDLWDTVKTKTQEAVDFIMRKIAWVGQAWAKTKTFFGFGEEGPQAGDVAGAGNPGALPSIPSGSIAGGGYTDNSQTTLNVTQQPGEDSKAFADRIMKMMEQRRQVNQRSVNYDQLGNAY